MQNLVYPYRTLPNGASTSDNQSLELAEIRTLTSRIKVDSFNRQRVSNPTGIFDAQFTYDLNPLIYEQITNGSGASIAHSATNRVAVMTFSSTPTGGKSYMQSYEYIPYQPGKSQQVFITFNFKTAVANCMKFAAYGDINNSMEFRQNGLIKQLAILSDTELGDQIIDQPNWNTDTLDGSSNANNPSGLTLDISKIQFFTLDFQALYSGVVRMGFDIAGEIVYAHNFRHANSALHTYIQYATLPIRVGMTCTGTVSTTMEFNCCSVASEGGREENTPYHFVTPEGTVTAGSAARTHLLSVRPKLTFNSITNRAKINIESIDIVNMGSNTIFWELCIGQAITTNTTFLDVNATYSLVEYNNLGTISGASAIVIDSGYVTATNQSKTATAKDIGSKFPFTLDAAGLQRLNGTVSLVVTGIGGASACRGTISWKGAR